MKFSDYIRAKYIILFITAPVILTVFLFLRALSAPAAATLFITGLLCFVPVFLIILDYRKKKAYIDELLNTFERLDKKYLIAEIITPGDSFDARIFYDILKCAGKSMADEVAAERLKSQEYADYIENWVHEIKTPISSAKLTVESLTGAAKTGLEQDLTRIETLVNTALYYAKGSVAEKDYTIKQTSLKQIVSQALRENSRLIIPSGISVKLLNLDIDVYTDIKWVRFILSQLIVNSVKYSVKPGGQITFEGLKSAGGAVLFIRDNGIGIPQCDVPRVFDKGFTGVNGRKYPSATGMGLYICKTLCDKLGLDIACECKAGVTTFSISFQKTDFYLSK